MTAIFEELRRLEGAHADGEICQAERDARRNALLGGVPAAEILDPCDNAPHKTALGPGHMLVLCLSVVGACVGATVMLMAQFTLALTLGVTVLAALTVALFRDVDG